MLQSLVVEYNNFLTYYFYPPSIKNKIEVESTGLDRFYKHLLSSEEENDPIFQTSFK